MSDDDLFYAEAPAAAAADPAPPWTVLIVDDDPGVHEITTFALGRVTFRGRPLRFLHAYSAAEGLSVVEATEDLALVFLDVVMETEDAGLRFVRALRTELERLSVRVVLRTGQPGQAPERQVIVDYDINDYKEKTELTADRLFVATVAALRAYDDLRTIERYKDAAYATLAQETGLGQQLLDFVPVPLLHADALLAVTGCNAPAAALLGVPAEAAVGQSLAVLLGDAALELAGGQPADIRITLAGGPCRLLAAPVLLADGAAGGCLVRLEAGACPVRPEAGA
ncbi:MAG TPA: hypothetical protein VEB20_08420 [Azospirillaceae bacterium]|nr:hypothetical protein [Azospirillaceae bacterium]